MTDLATEKLPPQNIEAEESVLGAMLLSPHAISAAEEILKPADFYRSSHGAIYAAIIDMHGRGLSVDGITLVDELDRTGQLESALGADRVHELAAITPSASNAAHYARIVADMATLRSLVRVGAEVRALGYDRPGEVHELLEQAEGLIFDVSQSRSRSSDLVSAKDAIGPAFAQLQERAAHGSDVIGVSSGLRVLDAFTSGFQDGNLIIVAARPSMGKSALALGIAAHVAITDEKPVALFTLEMSQQEIMQRMMSSVGMVDSQKIRNGRNLNAEDWESIVHASGKIEAAPIYIDDSALITVGEIRSKARRLKLQHPDLALVLIDYLQLMATKGSEENRVQEVSKISRSLKVLARELEVPIIALSQLSRAVEQRHDKRPILSDLRESGSIEQDADLVMFVYRDEYYNPESAFEDGLAGIAEVNIAKQRNGPTATVKLAFKKEYTRFSDVAR